MRGGLLVLMVVLGCLSVRSAHAQATETLEAGIRVSRVDGTRITIDRGTQAGVTVGLVGDVLAVRDHEGIASASVDLDLRLARAKVVEAKDTSATLTLDSIAGKVEVGSYFAYKAPLPAATVQVAFVRVLVRGTELVAMEDERPFVTLEALLADPSKADRAIDSMIAELKKLRKLVGDAFTDPPSEGPYRGKSSVAIVDGLDRAQVVAFLEYLDAFALTYIGQRWKFPDSFFNWVYIGAPSGETYKKTARAMPRFLAAREALRAGKLDDARAIYARVLADWPDVGEARDGVARIDRALLLKRAVATDPDDTASAFALMQELDGLRAFDAALALVAPLRQRTFDATRLGREQGIALVGLERWAAARDVFEPLAKANPDDKDLAEWAAQTRVQARAAAALSDGAAQLAVAQVLLAQDDWDAAVIAYRKVLDLRTSTAKQRADAARGQDTVSLVRQLDLLVRWTEGDIEQHAIGDARVRMAAIYKLLGQIADVPRASRVLGQLAERARIDEERAFALELMKKRGELTKDPEAWTALAFALLADDPLDNAVAAAKTALALPGADPDYAHLILAHAARMRGDMAEAEKHARDAAKDKTYAWPHIVLARVAAASGEWEDALASARKALELDKADSPVIRATVTASARGLQAFEALRTDPKSPRERLRLVRALADLGLVQRVKDEIGKLPKDGTWRSEGWWALVVAVDQQIRLVDRLEAARQAKPATSQRKRVLAELEGEATLRAGSMDEAHRIALARLYIADEKPHAALAVLGPLLAATPVSKAVEAVAVDARSIIPLGDQMKLAWDAFGRADMATARRLALEAQGVYDRVGVVPGRIYAREVRAAAHAIEGTYTDAFKLLDEARAIAAGDGDERRVSTIDRRRAGYVAEAGTNDDLAVALEANRKLCSDLDDESCLYFAEYELANLEQEEGRVAAALDHARAAWAIADRLGRADLARQARLRVALVAINANRVADAEQIALALVPDCRAAGDSTFEQAATMILGGVALLRGEGPQARTRFQQVYELGTRTGMNAWRSTARRFEGLAWMRADHDPKHAITALEAADELYKQLTNGVAQAERGIVLRMLAEARIETGDLAGARRAADDGFALATKYGKRIQLGSAHGIYALIALAEAKPDEAVSHAKDAVAIANQTDDVTLLWNAYYSLARAYELKKDDQQALAAYEAALTHLGRAVVATGADADRSGFMNTGRVREVYRNAIELLLRLGNATRAREVLELSRDALLQQAIDATKVATEDATVKATLERFNGARERVKALQGQLEKAVEKRNAAQLKTLADRLAKAREELDAAAVGLKGSDRQLFQAITMAPQELAARSAALPKGSVVVEYFVAADTLSIFVHVPGRTTPTLVRVKVGATQLGKTVDEYRDAVIAENDRIKQRDKVESLGRQLAGWLLEPVRAQLEKASTVVIIPFGPLYYVPFDALVVSEVGKPVRYAIEDYRFVLQTTWTIEALLEPARPRSTGRMLAIANPDGSLPGAQAEVNRIVKTALPDAQVLRKDATVKKVTDLAGTSRYLHVATHGILDADPRKSYLKLSDGPLTVAAIATLQGLRTHNNLVVLSACDTATELRESAGDDVVSLASSFALAGAPTVVASLWEISDDSTAELMATFYRSLETDKGDRLDALRSAKLNLLRMEKGKTRPFAAPWHWASFQLYGDFRAPPAK